MGVLDVDQKPTKDERELLEKNGIASTRPDLIISGRLIVGVKIRMAVMQNCKRLRNVPWGILRSQVGEFILPDRTPSGILPIEPHLCLRPYAGDPMLSEDQARELNKIAIASSLEWYLARDSSACPR